MLHSPQLGHSIQKLLLGELALGGGAELPRHHEHGDAGRVQRQVVAELLNAVDADLVLILRV